MYWWCWSTDGDRLVQFDGIEVGADEGESDGEELGDPEVAEEGLDEGDADGDADGDAVLDSDDDGNEDVANENEMDYYMLRPEDGWLFSEYSGEESFYESENNSEVEESDEDSNNNGEFLMNFVFMTSFNMLIFVLKPEFYILKKR